MLPLSGVRVLEVAWLLPGPLTGLMLQDLGAEVIKIEPPGGDYLRTLKPLAPDGVSILFHAINRGKRSLTLDLKSDSGKQHLEKLLATADVVINGFRPGVLDNLGFSWERLQTDFPQIILCAISGYGAHSDRARVAGHDVNFEARAGLLFPHTDREPCLAPVPIADICGGVWPALSQILAALLLRDKTKKGTFLDVSMTAFSAALLLLEYAKQSILPDVQFTDGGLLVGQYPCYGIYATKDGHIVVAALEGKFWDKLCDATDLPELKGLGRCDGEQSDTVTKKLTARLKERSTEDWLGKLLPLDICVDPIVDPKTFLKDPQSAPVRFERFTVAGQEFSMPVMPFTGTISSPNMAPAPSFAPVARPS